MQPIKMIMIYYWDKRNGGHLEHVKNESFELETSNQGFFFIVIISAARIWYLFFFEFHDSVINHYHINGCVYYEIVLNDFVSK